MFFAPCGCRLLALRVGVFDQPGQHNFSYRLPAKTASRNRNKVELEPVRKLGGILRRGILAVAKAARPAQPRSGL